MDDIPDFGDQSVVVFAVSKQLINLLSARMTKAKIKHGLITGDQSEYDRDLAINAFQAGHTKFILCTIQAGGTGITLSRGGIMAFLQRSWSLLDQTQAENRCQRPGAEEFSSSILKIDYVTPGTAEESVIRRLQGKGDALEDIVRDKDAIRRMLMGDEE
jgi:SNF2 family DNA or RNA helicase